VFSDPLEVPLDESFDVRPDVFNIRNSEAAACVADESDLFRTLGSENL
jgi:hypothetical protein